MVIYVDRVINMPIHYTFNIVFCKYRTHPTYTHAGHKPLQIFHSGPSAVQIKFSTGNWSLFIVSAEN